MFRSQIVIVLLASLAIFSQAQVARRTVSGTVYSQYGSSYIYVSIYCADSNVIYTTFSSSSYSYATSLTYSYTDCATRLGNNVNDPISVLAWADSTSYTQNTTVMESEFLAQVSGSSGVDFYPNTAVKIAALPISVSSSGSSYYTTYNFTLIVVGCGNGYRESSLGEECDGYGSGCDYDTCTCRSASGYYPDTSDLSNTDCVLQGYEPYGYTTSWLGVFLGIFIPIFVIIIVLSIVLRVLFIRGVIACCGVRRPRTTVQTVTVTQPATTTTTTTTAVVQGQQPGVTQVPYYPQPQQPQQQYAPQQYPVQQPMFVPQQGHVVPPPQQQQQHVMQYPPQQQQQPNVDGQVLPPQQYSQPMMQQQPYAPQPYPDQPTPYGYPGGNAPVQGGYVVYSPPPQGGAFQPQEPPK